MHRRLAVMLISSSRLLHPLPWVWTRPSLLAFILGARTSRVYISPWSPLFLSICGSFLEGLVILWVEEGSTWLVGLLMVVTVVLLRCPTWVHVEVHLFDLLAAHDVDGLLRALQVELELPILLPQLEALRERSQQRVSLFWQMVSPLWKRRTTPTTRIPLTLMSNKRSIGWLWFLWLECAGAVVVWGHLVEEPEGRVLDWALREAGLEHPDLSLVLVPQLGLDRLVLQQLTLLLPLLLLSAQPQVQTRQTWLVTLQLTL